MVTARPLSDAEEASATGTADPAPSAMDIGMQLRRILGTPCFATSTRSGRFLAYIVERTLAGEARLLKQYSIATGALGRGPEFDPDCDPLVRLEAGKLRRNLDSYYANQGAGDPVRISVPRGSYVPTFERVSAMRPDAGVGPPGGDRPAAPEGTGEQQGRADQPQRGQRGDGDHASDVPVWSIISA